MFELQSCFTRLWSSEKKANKILIRKEEFWSKSFLMLLLTQKFLLNINWGQMRIYKDWTLIFNLWSKFLSKLKSNTQIRKEVNFWGWSPQRQKAQWPKKIWKKKQISVLSTKELQPKQRLFTLKAINRNLLNSIRNGQTFWVNNLKAKHTKESKISF